VAIKIPKSKSTDHTAFFLFSGSENSWVWPISQWASTRDRS